MRLSWDWNTELIISPPGIGDRAAEAATLFNYLFSSEGRYLLFLAWSGCAILLGLLFRRPLRGPCPPSVSV